MPPKKEVEAPKLIAARVNSADRRLQKADTRAKVVLGIDGDTGAVKKMLVSEDNKNGAVTRKDEGSKDFKDIVRLHIHI